MKAVQIVGGNVPWPAGIVLIVDREDEVLEIVKTSLQSTGCVVLHAKTGEELARVQSGLNSAIDITIIDLDLLHDNCVVKSLLAILGRRKATKLIVKTSFRVQPFLEHVHHFGADAIVFKPISEKQLARIIQTTVDERRNASAGATAGTAA